MQPSIENIENIPLKRKPRAISTFLKKTFELLNVNFPPYSRNKKIVSVSSGHPMALDSLSQTNSSFQRLCFQSTSSTVITLHLCDR